METINCPNPDCNAEISSDVEKCPVCGTDIGLAMIALATEKIKENPKDAEGYVARGYVYASRGDHERALADLDYAIKLDPQNTAAYAIRGMKRVEMGNHQAAIADLNYAIKLEPAEADHYYYRGMAYAALKDIKSATADFDQVVRSNPKRTDVYMQRAMLYDDQGNTGRAIAELEKALQMTTEPYERTQIEDMLTKVRQFQSKKRQAQAGGFLMALLRGLGSLVVGIVKAVFRN
jgi:tetratricopeptide (TPR) repeat protein